MPQLLQEPRHELFIRILGYLPHARRPERAKLPPLSGSVSIAGQSPEALVGHAVELRLDSDPSMSAHGLIGADGSFRLTPPLDSSELRPGHYLARIVLGPEGHGRTREFGIPWRYLVFSTSGWSVDLPTVDELEFVVTA